MTVLGYVPPSLQDKPLATGDIQRLAEAVDVYVAGVEPLVPGLNERVAALEPRIKDVEDRLTAMGC